jgi:CheY-like chemotaxis protein
MDNCSLLLVEDDEVVSVVAEDALETGGYKVVVCRSGNDALARLDDQTTIFAGLITDIDLGPNPDGWEVARHAREIRPDIPVVYTTGHGGAEWLVHGVPNSLLVQKPYAPAQLLTAISTLITEADTHRTS